MKQLWIVSTKGKHDGMEDDGIIPVAVFSKQRDAMRYGNDMFRKHSSAFITPLVLNEEKDNLGDW